MWTNHSPIVSISSSKAGSVFFFEQEQEADQYITPSRMGSGILMYASIGVPSPRYRAKENMLRVASLGKGKQPSRTIVPTPESSESNSEEVSGRAHSSGKRRFPSSSEEEFLPALPETPEIDQAPRSKKDKLRKTLFGFSFDDFARYQISVPGGSVPDRQANKNADDVRKFFISTTPLPTPG